MLKQAKWLSFMAIFIVFLSFLTFSLSRRIEDQESAEPLSLTLSHTNKATTGKQIRHRVCKDFWIAEEKDRLHHRIESPRSTLFAHFEGKKTKIIEQMIEMKCYIQERLMHSEEGLKQKLRYIESEEGFYHYDNHHFNAEHVFIAFFDMPGNHLQRNLNLEKAHMTGHASQVQLSLANQNPTFYAEKFKAHINPQTKTHE